MRKIKMKQVMAVILAGGMLCAMLTGCSKPPDSMMQQTAGATEAETQTLPGKLDNEIPTSQTDSGKQSASDGEYVYDYQVSMDPIPKEIADLGGPCQGTIHAFPSKIEMGLTQKMMEEDPELKAEVEKRIPEVEQALKEEFGGEFRVDGVIAVDVLTWDFLCTEVDTEYQFIITYSNYAYSSKLSRSNDLYFEDYYDEIESKEVEQDLAGIIVGCYGEVINKVWVQSGMNTINLYIIQLIDGQVDAVNEQIKILDLWKALQDYNSETEYVLDIRYCPVTYREVMEQKCVQGNINDMILMNEEELLHNGELKDRFLYVEWLDGEGDDLDAILNYYEQGTYNEKKIWKQWGSK